MTWRKIGGAKVDKSGNYKFLDKPQTRLDRAYRVVKAKDDKAGKGTSRERGLHVLAWKWLTQTQPSATENVLAASSMPINGENYVQTLYGDRTQPTAFTEFTLGPELRSAGRHARTFGPHRNRRQGRDPPDQGWCDRL